MKKNGFTLFIIITVFVHSQNVGTGTAASMPGRGGQSLRLGIEIVIKTFSYFIYESQKTIFHY
jgi:hypothetical protein